jgi:hypothetical protein
LDGILLLAVERVDERLDSERCSGAGSQEGRLDVSEEEPDEVLRCLSRMDARFICLLNARILSGDGGPSTAGSRRSLILLEPCFAEAAGGLEVWAADRPSLLVLLPLRFLVDDLYAE